MSNKNKQPDERAALPKEPKRPKFDLAAVRFGECEHCSKRAGLHPCERFEGAMLCGACADNSYLEQWRDYAAVLREQLDALEHNTVAGSAGQAPEGWKLVPVEPDDAMIEAADKVWHAPHQCADPTMHVWDAMLAAAPTAPSLTTDAGAVLTESQREAVNLAMQHLELVHALAPDGDVAANRIADDLRALLAPGATHRTRE